MGLETLNLGFIYHELHMIKQSAVNERHAVEDNAQKLINYFQEGDPDPDQTDGILYNSLRACAWPCLHHLYRVSLSNTVKRYH